MDQIEWFQESARDIRDAWSPGYTSPYKPNPIEQTIFGEKEEDKKRRKAQENYNKASDGGYGYEAIRIARQLGKTDAEIKQLDWSNTGNLLAGLQEQYQSKEVSDTLSTTVSGLTPEQRKEFGVPDDISGMSNASKATLLKKVQGFTSPAYLATQQNIEITKGELKNQGKRLDYAERANERRHTASEKEAERRHNWQVANAENQLLLSREQMLQTAKENSLTRSADLRLQLAQLNRQEKNDMRKWEQAQYDRAMDKRQEFTNMLLALTQAFLV